MQFARLNDINMHYQWIGGPPGRPTLVFVNSLGTDFRIWRDVIVRLAGDFPVLNYDLRGHGLSDTGALPITIERLAEDLAALIDSVVGGPAIVCGVSIGGLIAQQLHHARADLTQALVLCDTAAKIGDAAFWQARMAAISAGGIEAIADGVLERWFSPGFIGARAAEYAGYRNMLTRQSASGYLAACGALKTADLTTQISRIAAPTLCVVGDQDGSTPPELVTSLARAIPRARLEVIADCGHLPCIEQPEALVEILRTFIAITGTEAARHVSH